MRGSNCPESNARYEAPCAPKLGSRHLMLNESKNPILEHIPLPIAPGSSEKGKGGKLNTSQAEPVAASQQLGCTGSVK